jgi:hypothetical protein
MSPRNARDQRPVDAGFAGFMWVLAFVADRDLGVPRLARVDVRGSAPAPRTPEK